MAADDFVSGALAGQQFKLNNQAMQLNKLSLDEGQLKIEADTIKVRQLKQLSDIQQKAMQAALKGQTESRSSTSSDVLFPQLRTAQDIALNEISMGAVDDGIEKLKGVMAIEENQLKITEANVKQADEKTEKLTRAFSGITDEMDPKAALAQFDQNVLFQQSVLGEKFDEKGLASIRQKIGDPMTRKQALAQMQSIQKKAKDDYEAARAQAEGLEPARKEAQTKLYDAQKRRADQLRIASEKNGNKPVKAAYITAAAAEIRKRHPGEKAYQESEEVQGLALPLAEEMEDLMKQPGMTETKALAIAYDHHKDEIHLRTPRPTKGTTKSHPLPVPKLPSGRINRADLQDGIYYEGLGVWNDEAEIFE
jgi:hypothetical protein